MKIMNARALIYLVMPFFAISFSLYAAEKSYAENQLSESNINLSVPESPAFTILDLAPQIVSRPTTPKELATSLLNGLDSKGNPQSGVAIDTAPYLLFFGKSLTIKKYREEPLFRQLARTQLSLATVKGTGDSDKSIRLSLGLHATLFDDGDPRLDKGIDSCFAEQSGALGKPLNPLLPPAELAVELTKRIKIVQDEAETCRSEARMRDWNKSGWSIGAAPSWISSTGDSKNLQYNGAGVWTSLAIGQTQKAQWIVHARYRNREQIADLSVKDKFFKQDSELVAIRYRFGSPVFATSFEAAYIHIEPEHQKASDAYRVNLGIEPKLSEGIWLNLSFGGQSGHDGSNGSKLFFNTALKWGFEDRSTLGPSPAS